MDQEKSDLIRTVSILAKENEDLRRQVKSLAMQNMKQARAMRLAKRAICRVIDEKSGDGAIYDEDDQIENLCRLALGKLNRATTGTL